LSLRAIGSSLRNLNSISHDRLDERILLLMPSVLNNNRQSTQPHQQQRRPTSQDDTSHFLSVDLNKSNNLAIQQQRTFISSAPNINKIEANDMSQAQLELSGDLSKQMPSAASKDHRRATVDTAAVVSDQVQVYVKRWIILIIFCLVSLLSAFNWIEYGIIQDVVIAFYNESLPEDTAARYDAVNWLSMVYMLCYIPLVFPAMFLLERKGLRLSCILGALLTTVGAAIKVAGVQPQLFAVAMLGQTICAIAQAFTLGVPARLSALWFGPNEIGLATSVT
jgi:hypothetical protein